ncbi:MAG: FAD-dependent oxidoreductase [Blastocatellia bacterium]
MANILVLGGGFGGVTAAESLAKRLKPDHQITLISRQREFIFYPALVRLAFGYCALEDVSFDLSQAMHERRVDFVQSEIAWPDPGRREVIVTHGQLQGKMPYDYCVFALGRRLATEQVPGFYEHAHHLLTVKAALKFREALHNFHRGHAVIGYCRDARLSVPVYETAFALDRMLRERGERDQVRITVVSPEKPGGQLGGPEAVPVIEEALADHGIEFRADFPVAQVLEKEIRSDTDERLDYDLLMLLPPFSGPGEAMYTGITDSENYVRVNNYMQVTGAPGMYAAGDCVNLIGPKMGHMAVLQGEVAAANLAAEVSGHEPAIRYDHELMLVIDEGGEDSIFLYKDLWERKHARVSQGLFWGWAKQINQKYWQRKHS